MKTSNLNRGRNKVFRLILLFIMAACIFPLSSFSQQNDNTGAYIITGNIKGLGSDSVIIIINNYDQNGKRLKPDTMISKAKEDKFQFTGKIGSTVNAWANTRGFKSRKNFSFYLEKGTIIINGYIDALDEISITGTPSNNEQTETRKHTNSIFKRVLPLREKLKTVENNSAEYKNITTDINAKYDSIQAYEMAFIRAHPNSYMSATLLWVKQDKLPLDELESLYNTFPVQIQNSSNSIAIREKIKARKFVAVGNYAPDFISKDTSGNLVRLSDFKGKYVLLEFWANWCVPCRAEHPNLVALYEKYKDKGFDILQYSVDELNAAEKWKAAIVKDKLIWTQTSDLDGFESKVSKMYGVQPIPDGFLIDPNGKILARGLRGKELEEKLKSVLE